MRICSFIPSATEILFALGAGDDVVGVTHECDFPPEAATRPKVVCSRFDPKAMDAASVDALVRRFAREGTSPYRVDVELLRRLRPDVVVTQDVCDVCALSAGETMRAVEALETKPTVISLHPHDLDGILETVLIVGEAVGREVRARQLVESLRERIAAVARRLKDEKDRPRVVVLEWLDPPYVAGHWVPEMVETAGGEHGLVGKGEPSVRVEWEAVVDYAPQVVLIAVCGYDVERTLAGIEALTQRPGWFTLPAVKKGQVYVMNANAYFSRPAPRVVEGLEITAHVLHPEGSEYTPPPEAVINLRNYLHLQHWLG